RLDNNELLFFRTHLFLRFIPHLPLFHHHFWTAFSFFQITCILNRLPKHLVAVLRATYSSVLLLGRCLRTWLTWIKVQILCKKYFIGGLDADMFALYSSPTSG